jgi:phosphoglucomutase
MEDVLSVIQAAASDGRLLSSSAANIAAFLEGSPSPVAKEAIAELVAEGNWGELDNRFFRTLAFGTGGLRGKSIGAIVTAAERGQPDARGRPEFPCVGTNAMNFFNVSRATQGLVRYVLSQHRGSATPSICVCHDTRFFSREFAELASEVIAGMGCNAHLFEGPRSTPELSFAVRHVGAQAGINITASHNPPQYSGYKVYFADGGQVVEPHASGIIAEVDRITTETFTPAAKRGRILPMGREVDEAYLERLLTLPLNAAMLRSHSPKIVFTPLHGVGGVIIKPALQRLGVRVESVAEQDVPDGRFPTVKSPNPEDPAALEMAIHLANQTGADVVIATDPDDDRLGVAARDASGRFVPLTGNQTGSLLCWYRITRHFELGILNETNASRSTVIKTFVTTDLQSAIAHAHGVRCVETLTGFKYIGEKLEKYERALPADQQAGYRLMSEEKTRSLRLAHSTYYIFGGEESYGYSASDFVRDKDGNSAAVMVAEVAAYAASRGLSLVGLLDEIHAAYGVYHERGESLVMDGAEGAAKIQSLVASYVSTPPTEVDGSRVEGLTDFSKGGIVDSEGDPIPAEAMLILTLADGRRVAIRPSGTEPKIKYYMFARELPPGGRTFDPEELVEARQRVEGSIAGLWRWLSEDAARRVG